MDADLGVWRFAGQIIADSARALFVGLDRAVRDRKRIMQPRRAERPASPRVGWLAAAIR
ncbi:hypothetical protein [uncultured Thiocystis sp.]|jgi:hypothetical protein|uniref:hypothetical protein n=1 Tax=uncultured Thiocystis sp. TaxID=1202134 RepID=UPI0025F3D0DD|nr:hypothetical protein [uncultured Thiocystis sp.]